MADISVTYEEINTVSQQLNSVATKTVPTLADLQRQVAALLEPNGGLWLIRSSPLLKEKYTNFNTSVTEAVNSIPQWAIQFQNIASSVKDLDRAIVESSNS
jgi:uncharacterized protein YukE